MLLVSAQGKNNKLLKKIYKALKMPQDSTYLEDIVDIADNKVMMQFLTLLIGCHNTNSQAHLWFSHCPKIKMNEEKMSKS